MVRGAKQGLRCLAGIQRADACVRGMECVGCEPSLCMPAFDHLDKKPDVQRVGKSSEYKHLTLAQSLKLADCSPPTARTLRLLRTSTTMSRLLI